MTSSTASSAARGVVVEPVAAAKEERISVPGGEIRVRLLSPEGAGPHPAFVHFHGGGFVLGTIDSLVNEAKCTHICRAAGCVVATVEYRLAPEHRFPTAAEDCYAALRWTVVHAASLGIDPNRVAVGGESAGGNLAAVVSLMARDRGGPELALQLLEVPVTDLSIGCRATTRRSRYSAKAMGSTRPTWTSTRSSTSATRPTV